MQGSGDHVAKFEGLVVTSGGSDAILHSVFLSVNACAYHRKHHVRICASAQTSKILIDLERRQAELLTFISVNFSRMHTQRYSCLKITKFQRKIAKR